MGLRLVPKAMTTADTINKTQNLPIATKKLLAETSANHSQLVLNFEFCVLSFASTEVLSKRAHFVNAKRKATNLEPRTPNSKP